MPTVLVLSLSFFVAIGNATASFSGVQSTVKPGAAITEGVGIAGVFIDKSTEPQVVAIFGNNYKVAINEEYSREIVYADLGLTFYSCLKDTKKRIFLIEVHRGTTSKGIVIGQSTLKDVHDIYGTEDNKEDCGSGTCVYEYKGVQFYFEAPKNADPKDPDPSQMKVVEIDVVAPGKSSNFCDAF